MATLHGSASAMSHLTTDARMQRMNAVRQAARIAFLKVQTDQAMQRALLHRSRVKKTHYEPGDLVFIFREKRPEKGKKPVKMWIGPCTVVGSEGQNLWVSKGGCCLLCAKAGGGGGDFRASPRQGLHGRRAGDHRRG